MYYLIQENTHNEKRYATLIETLERMGLQYEIVKFRPFIDEVDFKTDRKDVWFFGGYTMTTTAEKYGFKPGCMINENHDFLVYSQYYKDSLLNHDAIILDFGDPIPDGDDWDLFFARPTKDAKLFTAAVYDRAEWTKYINATFANETVDLIKGQTKVVISSPKNIYQEIRCWVVGGKVVTISQYKLGSKVIQLNLDHDNDAMVFAQEMVDIYQPARAFVMDICRCDDGFKIVEINCINGAGFYDMNPEKLLTALESEFN
jgi:hypothetical protein